MRALVMCGVTAFVLSTAAAASAATGPVSAARHHGVVSGETIRWTSEYLLRPNAPDAIELAYPLPGGTAIDVPQDAAAVEHAGRVTALRLRPETAFAGRVVVTITEPLARHGREVRLSPPLAAGDAVQIVDVEGGDDLRFEPDPRTELARHVGFFAPVDLPFSARDATDRAVGYVRVRLDDNPVYLRVSAPIVADEGIRGVVVSGADRLRTGALGAGGVFAMVVLGLVLLQRRLARAAKIEEGERALAAEFAKLDGKAG